MGLRAGAALSGIGSGEPGVFHPILVREGRAAQVEVRDFGFVRWADHIYYEVCANPELIAATERRTAGQPT